MVECSGGLWVWGWLDAPRRGLVGFFSLTSCFPRHCRSIAVKHPNRTGVWRHLMPLRCYLPPSPLSSCLWATALTCCWGGSGSWTAVSRVLGRASRYQSPCVMFPERCATKSARIPPPTSPPPLGQPLEVPWLGRPWCLSLRVLIRLPIIRNHVSSALNQRKGPAYGPPERSTATARAFGWKWTRFVGTCLVLLLPTVVPHVESFHNTC